MNDLATELSTRSVYTPPDVPKISAKSLKSLERAIGIEPTTSSLGRGMYRSKFKGLCGFRCVYTPTENQ